MDNSTDEAISQMLNKEFVQKTFPFQVILGVLLLFGVFGNVSVIYIFMIHFKKTVFRIFVVSLAFVDTLICCYVIPADIYMMRLEFVFTSNLICRILTSLKMFLVSTSVILLFCLSIDRCRNVCQPLKSQISIKVAKIFVVCSFLFAFVLTVPTFLLMHITEGSCTIPTSDVMKTKNLLIVVLSAFGLMFIYTLIGISISRHRLKRKSVLTEIPSGTSSTSSDGSVKKKRKLHKGTKIAFTICAFYVISYIPSSLIIYFIKFMIDRNSTLYVIFYCMSRMYVLNSVVNPVIYGFWDTKFRQNLRRYFCCKSPD